MRPYLLTLDLAGSRYSRQPRALGLAAVLVGDSENIAYGRHYLCRGIALLSNHKSLSSMLPNTLRNKLHFSDPELGTDG